ncbi:corticotropin-releasing factor receptor 1-like [Clytia hemisphaerica]|uniref:Uncharacterized protein n=1 Tax=Clytia hemisphaerica TaxID=252671 RepID=A0A7M5TSY8_9CNID
MEVLKILLCSLALFVPLTESSFDFEDFISIFRKKILECSMSKGNLLNSGLQERCKTQLDSFFSCWPNTPVNTTYITNCPKIAYYESDTVSRRCFANQTWEKVNYNLHCRKLPSELVTKHKQEMLLQYGLYTQEEIDAENELIRHTKLQTDIKYYLRCFDLSICAIGFLVLLVFIPWDNSRIMLHRNLIISFLFDDLINILIQETFKNPNTVKECSILMVVQKFFFLAQICWMFNEGFFQFRQFFFVFIEKTYLWIYLLFGWGFPLIWTFGIYFPILWTYPPLDDFAVCWYAFPGYKYNYIIYSPAFVLLLLNIGIMAYLMWMIWSKLKASKTGDLKTARKAARGFFICMFLLGGGYVFTLYGPANNIGFMYFRAIVQATQGIMVCILHVFLSKEVQEAVKTKINRFLAQHNIELQCMNKKKNSNGPSTKHSNVNSTSNINNKYSPKTNKANKISPETKLSPPTPPPPDMRPNTQAPPKPRENPCYSHSFTLEIKNCLTPSCFTPRGGKKQGGSALKETVKISGDTINGLVNEAFEKEENTV